MIGFFVQKSAEVNLRVSIKVYQNSWQGQKTYTIRVKIEVEAIASGSGSYADLNFQDGSANRIIPVLLLANLA